MYFQQRRATLLAATLVNRLGSERLKTCRICIVGGGVAGLTFLLAIKNEYAENATLFEASSKPLGNGSVAKHRLVHPNYNRWPLLGSMDSFTSLPVMNWYAASADNVMQQLMEQIRTDYNDLYVNRVKLKHKVKRILDRGDQYAQPLRVIYETESGGAEQYKDFDIVVIAAGFACEGGAEWGFGDYWTQDAADFDVDEHRRPCTVFGTGDGALIDILRCCTKQPDNAWLIPLGTIARLRPEDATTLPIDRDVDIVPRQTTFSSVERSIQAHEENVRCIAWAFTKSDADVSNAYAGEEERFYRSCVSEIRETNASLYNFIEHKLKPAASGALVPRLIGSFCSPFEPTSAPINKLLLAHLLETNRIVYSARTREEQAVELSGLSTASAVERGKRITICRYGAAKNFPIPTGSELPQNGVLIGTSFAEAAAETDTEARVIDSLASITGGEYLYFDSMPHPLTRARYGLYKEGLTHETRQKNSHILERFAEVHLGATSVRYEFKDSDGKLLGCPKWVILTGFNRDDVTEKLKELGGLDGNFFGAPIVVNFEMSADGDERL